MRMGARNKPMAPMAALRMAGLQSLAAAAGIALCGCYSMRSSNGGGQTDFQPSREIDAASIAVPRGYAIEAVASGLTFPTGAAFDDSNRLHIVESGYSYGELWATPRLLRIEADGTAKEIARGADNGPWTGVDYADGRFYVAEGGVLEGGRILEIAPEGSIRVIVDGLPSFGDHHTDGPAVSEDGWIYFGRAPPAIPVWSEKTTPSSAG